MSGDFVIVNDTSFSDFDQHRQLYRQQHPRSVVIPQCTLIMHWMAETEYSLCDVEEHGHTYFVLDFEQFEELAWWTSMMISKLWSSSCMDFYLDIFKSVIEWTYYMYAILCTCMTWYFPALYSELVCFCIIMSFIHSMPLWLYTCITWSIPPLIAALLFRTCIIMLLIIQQDCLIFSKIELTEFINTWL